MLTSKSAKLFFLFLVLQLYASDSTTQSFIKCVSINSEISLLPISTTFFFTPNDSAFTSVLRSTAQNLRYLEPSIPKPQFIFTPIHDFHVRASVICSKKIGIHLLFRSGGHDYEGLSYASQIEAPFAIIDLSNLRQINVDVADNTAWVQSGATIGEVYYRISQRSSVHAFPAGIFPGVGIGGHITGGAYGALMRKYGLGADNVVDAKIVDFNGTILDRREMGEDLFWAIRGGGGGSFGIILWWKIKLVPVPEKVTFFTVARTLEQGAMEILNKWQRIVDKLDEDLFIRAIIESVSLDDNMTTLSTEYNALFLGDANELLQVMENSFPELGLGRKDCIEMSWIQSVVSTAGYPIGTPIELLLEGKPRIKYYFKAKSDYASEPVPTFALKELWKRMMEGRLNEIILTPFGGMMSKISESEIPFPHRNGTKFMIQYISKWKDPKEDESKRLDWMREVYDYMGPYVSKFPREAYVNYRDIDLGVNDMNSHSFEKARVWGEKYFKIENLKRLMKIKAKCDPENFFRHEQSIPLLAVLPESGKGYAKLLSSVWVDRDVDK